MSVWLEIPRRHPDGRHKASRWTTMGSAFQILEKFFLELSCVQTVLPCRPNGRTLAARNFYIKASCVRTMTSVVRKVNLMHAISIYEVRAFGPWRPSSGRLNFECETCLMDERVRTGIHIVRMVATVFPYMCFGKKSHYWSNTEWRPDMLLKLPDGCKPEEFEACRHRGRSGRKVLVVRTNDALDNGCLYGISCCPDGCKGSDFSDLESVQNLQETYLWRRLLKTDWTPD
jgi:hypothetical protein